MTREQLIKALREHARVDSLFGNDVRKHLSEQAADMLEADGVPVAWIDMDDGMIVSSPRSFSDGSRGEVPLYMAPQPATQERKPLTDEQISKRWEDHITPVFGKNGINPIVFARAIEAAHGITENKP